MSDEASDRVTGALADAITAGELGDDTQGIPGQWVLIGTYYDSEGENCTVFLTNNGARMHETLGLLALGTVAWNEQAARWVHDNEE